MERYHGRPAEKTGRLEKELRCYDALDALGIAYDRVENRRTLPPWAGRL